MSKAEQLEQIRQAVLNLTESPLYAYRTENNYHPVIGEGSADAKIMFIGEAPGKNEAEQGRPFVGASGRVLDELLSGVGLQRADVYITNIVKDRPPDNRDPRKDEIKLYAPFLDQQIEAMQPEVIVTLGRFSMEFILTRFDAPEKTQKISALHGRKIAVQASYGTVYVVPLFHPAVSLYNVGQKATLVDDFQVLKEFAP
ncbi:MAG: type-4 uracil-DNA glycosylase [Anaerolineae bacterium]